jgi:RTX calcium-binding nonapeptide repeat (4 copies)
MTALRSTEQSIDPAQLPENLIMGGSGSDQIRTFHRREHVVAGSGDDIVYASDGLDTFDGGAGTDKVDYSDAVVQQTFNLSSLGVLPEGVQPDPGDGLPYYNLARTAGTDLLLSIEKIYLSDQANTLAVSGGIDLRGLLEVDAGGQADGTQDVLDLSQLGKLELINGKINGFDTTFKNFERVVLSSDADNVKLASGDARFTGFGHRHRRRHCQHGHRQSDN